MSESTSFTQSNTGGVNFQNQISGGQVNQGESITINNGHSVASSGNGDSSEAEDAKTILFLAANPNGTTKLQLDKELREIDESLRRAQKRAQFKLESKGAVRKQDLFRAVLDTNPKIIHFSGHGTDEEGLALENAQGNVAFLSAATVDGLFEIVAEEGVECVLLNACYSEVQAKAIQKHIPYVIGMNQSITDEAAIQFATTFYDAIAAGRNIEKAFKFGRVQLLDLGQGSIPQLLRRSV